VTAVRPYVDRPVTDRDRAASVAADAAASWGLPEPRFLRLGMNALFACGDVVLRVGSSTAPAAAAHALVSWLLDHDIPTVRPVEGLARDADGFAVTGWAAVREARRAVDWSEIGAIVRRVHALPLDEVPGDYPVPDPTTFPWWQFDALLADVGDDIDPAALAGLRAAVARHGGWRERVRRNTVLCHGDVHPGNVMMSGAGPLLVDWDLLCAASPAWDMAVLTVGERWGRDPAEYDRFRAGYGPSADGDLDDLAHELGELRNVAATLMRVRAGRTDPAAAAEAAERLRFWRGDPDAPLWQAQ
jgi:aminoglycoside phosphotransferase (APT) family kinase protein